MCRADLLPTELRKCIGITGRFDPATDCSNYLSLKLFWTMYSNWIRDPRKAYPQKNAEVTLFKPSSILSTSSRFFNNLLVWGWLELVNQYCHPSLAEFKWSKSQVNVLRRMCQEISTYQMCRSDRSHWRGHQCCQLCSGTMATLRKLWSNWCSKQL